MAEAIYDAMGSVLTRWTMGSAAAPAATVWSAELGAEPAEAELRLLALSGQFLGIAVTAEPPPELRVLPDIPALALPTMPEPLRPLVRRILAAFKETQRKTEVLDFLAARGWTSHPAEWMPTANDEDAPDVYAPWRDWAGIAASSNVVRRQAGDRLTADNWEDFWPAARKVALTELRRHDPEAARTVLEAKLASENADVRLPLLSLLATGLSEADIPFLEGLAANDRAPKVKALAASLLARLGRGSAVGGDIAELAGFFSVKMKGLLRRSRVIQFENVKTSAQVHRRDGAARERRYRFARAGAPYPTGAGRRLELGRGSTGRCCLDQPGRAHRNGLPGRPGRRSREPIQCEHIPYRVDAAPCARPAI